MKILKTASSLGGRSLGRGYVKYNGEEYVPARRDDPDSIYGTAFNFSSVQPRQEIRTEVWFMLSISRVEARAVKDIDIPKNLHTFEDAFIKE